MSLISVINKATGESSLQESNDAVLCYAADSEGNYLGLIELEEGMLHTSGPPPDISWYWEDKVWKKKPPTLEQLQNIKWDEIKLIRQQMFDAPLTTPYGIFDSDAEARANIADAVLLAKSTEELGIPTPIDFTLADNTVVSLNTTEMTTVGILLGSKIQNTRAIATALRTAIYATESPEALEEIEWPE